MSCYPYSCSDQLHAKNPGLFSSGGKLCTFRMDIDMSKHGKMGVNLPRYHSDSLDGLIFHCSSLFCLYRISFQIFQVVLALVEYAVIIYFMRFANDSGSTCCRTGKLIIIIGFI